MSVQPLHIDADDETMLRDSLRAFIERRILPNYDAWEKARGVPPAVWQEIGEAGFLCVDLPEEHGGPGGTFGHAALVLDEFSRAGAAGLAAGMSVHSDIVTPYLTRRGTPEQQGRWLPDMAAGTVIGAIAMTEPGTGSDLQAITTRAERTADGWRINGQKTFISNGANAGMVIIVAKTDPKAGARGISLFLADATLPGFRRGRTLEKLGMHCQDTAALFFDDLDLPEDALLGEEGTGFAILMEELARERLVIAVMCAAGAAGTLNLAIDYVKERKAFGAPLSALQNTRFVVAELSAEIAAGEALVEKCVREQGAGTLTGARASEAKLWTSELQGRVADRCLQLFGGYGYMAEYPVSRAFRDARVQRIYGGTSEIMKELIARDRLGR